MHHGGLQRGGGSAGAGDEVVGAAHIAMGVADKDDEASLVRAPAKAAGGDLGKRDRASLPLQSPITIRHSASSGHGIDAPRSR